MIAEPLFEVIGSFMRSANYETWSAREKWSEAGCVVTIETRPALTQSAIDTLKKLVHERCSAGPAFVWDFKDAQVG